MTITKLRPTYTFDEDRLAQLRAVVPEAFADGKIDWDTLRDLLGDAVEDPAVEHFGLSWPGKREARRLASRPSRGALVPVPGEGVNEDSTRNIFIEGENLEVLKLLLKSYAGRIKMIYIDPPYNTGNDFIYSDDFSEPLDAYLRRTKQADDEGVLKSNLKSSGRYHSNWLSMMYPRLRLAKDLLTNNGVIFASIDDNEVHHLRLVMDELFGPENLVAQIPWQSRQSVQNDTDLSVNHEYIVGYAKARRTSDRRLKESNARTWYGQASFAVFPLPLDPSRFSNPDDDPRGPWKADPFDAPNIRPNLTYTITNPNTGELHWPPEGRCWRTEEAKFLELRADNRIVFGRSGNSRPQLKVFYQEKKDFGEIQTTWFTGSDFGTSTGGTRELQDLFDGIGVFDSPKPTVLLRALLSLASREDDIVLDFFAGSCSLAHAVYAHNLSDGRNRRFICVQLPEPTQIGSLAHQKGFQAISEIGKERIRRVITRVSTDRFARLPLDLGDHADLGFRVYRLERSHFKPWTDYSGDDVAALQAQFDAFESPLVDGWKPDDLLVEIMLIEGFPLDSKVTRQTQFAANDVRLVESDFHEHRLWVCLDQRVEASTVSDLVMTNNDVFICLDSTLDDEMKLQLSDGGNLKTI